ncbi:MAG: hypothetical protein L0216_10445 [Planctomycetales bacterium]|nr:hypothetical protein [Planctomycetales bacterium]
MRTVVGLHLGRTRITAVGLSGSAKSPRVAGCFTVPRPAGPAASEPGALGKAVRALLGEHGLPRDPVVVGVPADECLLRPLALPFTSPDQIRRVLKGEAESALPSHAVEDLLVSAHLIGDVDGRGRALAVAFPKEAMRRLLADLEPGGLDPVSVDVDGFGLVNALAAVGEVPEKGILLAADVEADEARFAVVADGRVRLVRTVPIPIAAPGGPAGAGGDGLQVLPEGLDALRAELTRTLVAAAVDGAPDKVVLTGSLAEEPAVRAAVAETTGGEPTSARPVGNLPGAPAPDAPCGRAAAVALGLAWKALGTDRGEVDLRLEEFSFRRAFDQVKGPLATFVTLVFLLCALGIYHFNERRKEAQTQLVQAVLKPALDRFNESWPGGEVEKKALLQKLLAEEPAPHRGLLPRMISLLREKKTELEGGPAQDSFPMRSLLDVWRDWADRLMLVKQGYDGYWVLNKIELTPSGVRCEGLVNIEGGRTAVDRMMTLLRENPDFAETNTDRETKPTPDGSRLAFGVQSRLPPEEAPKR